MDESAEPRSIDAALREVARTRAIAAALLHGAAAAEVDDVLQEASVAALAPGAPRGEAFAHWIRGAVRHLSVTVLRRRERRVAREREAARPVALPSTADVAHRLALQRVLLAEVEALGEPMRSAIVRRYLDDVPPREIAREQKVPLATVKTRLRRGLAQLRERLNREWGEELGGALLVLARGEVGAAAATAAGASTIANTAGVGAAVGGVLAMSFKAKIAMAAVAVVAIVATSLELARRKANSRGGAPIDSAASANARRDSRDGSAADGASLSAERRAETMGAAAPASGRASFGAALHEELVGRIVDENGKAVGGARVDVFGRIGADLNVATIATDEGLPRDVHHTTSAEDGSFRCGELAREVVTDIVASDATGRRGVVRDARTGAMDPVVVKLKATATIVGIVVDARDGQPVAHATVAMRAETADLRPALATADAQGRFEFTQVGGDGAMLFAAAPDGRTSGPCTPQFASGGRVDTRITVGLAGASDGTVVDADDGEPVPDVAIILQPWNDVVAARSDESGAFQVRPAQSSSQGVVYATLVAPGYARTDVELRAPRDPDGPAPSTLVKLRRARVATGSVVARDGTPLVGATVFAVRAGGDPQSNVDVFATTRDDGTFRIEGLQPGSRHVLLIRRADVAWSTLFPQDELASPTVDLGTIRVGVGATVRGRVEVEGETPSTTASVELITECGDRIRLMSEATGHFEFEGVPPGRSTLRASADGFGRPAETTLDLRDEDHVDSIVLTIPAGLSIAGRVTDAHGSAVQKASVFIYRTKANRDAPSEDIHSTSSDSDGRFRIAGLGSGTFMLSVSPRGSTESRSLAQQIDRVESGSVDLQIVLVDGAFVSGHVVDGHGNAIGGAVLSLVDSSGVTVSAARKGSDRDGSFRILVPAGIELRLEARVFDPRHPGPVMENPPAATLDHLRGDGSPVELVIENH